MPKKKGKVNKLAKMSDEERARYMQHRADLEEEARRRKQELISRFVKLKLEKEEAFSKKNTAKINESWRQLLRKIKCKQMTHDIHEMKQSFDFLVERKNKLIQTLMKALEDADDQHRRLFQTHTESISYFYEIGTIRLDNLQDEYETQKNNVLECWDKEYADIVANQESAELKLHLIIFQQNKDYQEFKKNNDSEVAQAKNDKRLMLNDEIEQFRIPKEQEIESYWSQLRSVYLKYLKQQEPISDEYNALRAKDDFYKRDIARNTREIYHAQKTFRTLQNQLKETKAQTAYNLARLAEEKELLRKKYSLLKKSTKNEGVQYDEILAIMVDASQDAIQRLEQTKKRLDKVVQMDSLCRKLEFENERLWLPEQDEGIECDQEQAGHKDMEDTYNDPLLEEYRHLSKLDHFFLRVNRVRVQNLCLRAEKEKLNKENALLKNRIKKYLTDLALNNGRSRPASTNFKSSDNDVKETLICRPVTCIEGALSNAVLHEKRTKFLEKKYKDSGVVKSYPRLCW